MRKQIFTLVLLGLMCSVGNVWAYEGASGNVAISKVNSSGKAVKLGDGCYAYRTSSGYSYGDGNGLKTQSNQAPIVFYLSKQSDVMAKIKHTESKNAHIVTGKIYKVSSSDYAKFYAITTETSITYTAPTGTEDYSLTVSVEATNNTFSGTKHLSSGYYAIICNGEKSNTYFNSIEFQAKGAGISSQSTSVSAEHEGTAMPISVVGTKSNESNTLHYQWYSCDSNGENGVIISGATSASYSGYSTLTATTLYFYCTVTEKAGETQVGDPVTSNVITVTIATATAPTITVQPEDIEKLTHVEGGTFSVEASGIPSPTYQWYSCDDDSRTNPVPIGGATSASYSVTKTTAGIDHYFVRVSNKVSYVDSEVATLTVNKRTDKVLTKAVFSNSFDAFVKESNHTVAVYYMEGESTPTLSSYEASAYATAALAGNTLTVTAEDESTQDYTVTFTSVTPYTGSGKQFDGDETWIITGGEYKTTTGSGSSIKNYYAWVINKNSDDDDRKQLGKTRIYFFVGANKCIKLINDRGSSLSTARPIKVYVNGVEQTYVTSMPAYTSGTPKASITIHTGNPAMVEIASNQTSGDTGWGSIEVTSATHDLTINSYGWASLYLPYQAMVPTSPAGATAYYASAKDGSTITLSPIAAGDVIPAYTGVVVKGTASTEYTFAYNTKTPEDVASNLLKGEVAEKEVEVNSTYVLATGDASSCTFKSYTNAGDKGNVTLGAYKAYILTSSLSSAPDRLRIIVEENNATNIEDIEVKEEAVKFIENGKLLINRDGIIYDALGRKVR